VSDTITNFLTRLGIIGVVKGATTAKQATVSDLGADHNGLDISDGGGSLTVDGAVSVSNFPATQPVSGTVTANIGSSGSLALDATLTGGTQIAIAKGAAASGAAVSGNPVLVAGSDGTNARTIATDTSGRTIAVGAAATGAAVAGSPVYVAGIDGGGLVRPLLVSAAGNGQVSAAKGTTVSSSAAEASHVISASACLVAKIRGYNGNAGVRYFQGHNASSLPGNGAVPSVVSEQATSAHAQEVNFAIPTNRFSTGCVVATSSTGATLTIGAADATFTVDLYPANA